jgi:transcriptional regulator with XRE-family HTH domain
METHPLTKYRADHGLTLEEFGKLVGVGRAAVCKWEAGKVPAERVRQIEAVTGIPASTLRPDIFAPMAQGQAA